MSGEIQCSEDRPKMQPRNEGCYQICIQEAPYRDILEGSSGSKTRRWSTVTVVVIPSSEEDELRVGELKLRSRLSSIKGAAELGQPQRLPHRTSNCARQ